jgi:hypothetical protein
MRILLSIFLVLAPTAVFADVGHIGEAFGHDHWLGVAALGAAVALGLWGILKGAKNDADDKVDDADTEEAQEA